MNALAREYAITLDAVTRRYGTQAAVSNVSLRIARGSKLGLLGVNGAGKSTTIKLIMGVQVPNSGTIQVLGYDPYLHRVACSYAVGYVPENHTFHRWMRVEEVLRFCRSLYPAWDDALVKSLQQRLGVPLGKRVRELSKGTLAKLSLLLALAFRPEVLLLDEPTSGLDPLVRDDFLDGILRSVCESEQTVVFSSHILADIERLADSVAIIHGGRLVMHAATDELIESTKRLHVVLERAEQPVQTPGGIVFQSRMREEWQLTACPFLPAVVEELRAKNSVRHVRVADMNLEEIFKDIVRGQEITA